MRLRCEYCRKRLKTLWRMTRYSGDEVCSHKMIRAVIVAFRSECSGCVRAAYARLGRPGRHAREAERGRLTLKSCPACADERLSFEFQRYTGRRWKTLDESSFARVFPVGEIS